MRRSDLEMALMSVPDFVSPHAGLEQYRTPAAVAAGLLWEAHQEGEIRGKRVVDLGCGTGMFAIGARVLRAAEVTGIDIDVGALELARHEGVRWLRADVDDIAEGRELTDLRADTVFSNPPFGAQNKGADRPFYKAAASILRDGGAMWFLAQPKTESFLGKEADRLGGSLERIMDWDYPIEARFAFHRHEVRTFHVAGYRMGF